MKDARRVALAALVCCRGAPRQGASPVLVRGAADTRALAILQSELQRNFQMLKQQAAPAYFISYTLHDTRSTQHRRVVRRARAQRRSRAAASPPSKCASATTTLDNTHPIRGDSRRDGPARQPQVALPLTDDEKPIRLALWRATDRTYKQASEALTRVKTNVAAKVKEEDPAPDFSREEPQTYTGDAGRATRSTRRRGRRGCAASRRRSPKIRSSSAATCRCRVDADNRYYTNSEGTADRAPATSRAASSSRP